jgi:hypothetical protein
MDACRQLAMAADHYELVILAANRLACSPDTHRDRCGMNQPNPIAKTTVLRQLTILWADLVWYSFDALTHRHGGSAGGRGQT